jgi:hypothetical protein
MMRTGFTGQACACAIPAAPSAASANATIQLKRLIIFLPEIDRARLVEARSLGADVVQEPGALFGVG